MRGRWSDGAGGLCFRRNAPTGCRCGAHAAGTDSTCNFFGKAGKLIVRGGISLALRLGEQRRRFGQRCGLRSETREQRQLLAGEEAEWSQRKM